MATPTYIPLATVTLAASSSAIFFTNISQDYSDLVLVREFTSTSNHSAYAQFNGDNGNNYSWVTAQAQNTADSSAGTTNSIFGALGYTTVAGLDITQIMDYSATDKHKTILQRRDTASALTGMFAYRWANTDAITSITSISSSSHQFAAGSTFKLFGIHGEV
tara:strand:+ start:2347 stop:2832 length:486 start_codon:yes stop_codon:yes gene_type:complete